MMQTPSPENPGLLNWALLVLVAIIWGASFMLMTVTLEGFAPAWVAAGRLAMASLALALIGAFFGQPVSAISKSAGVRGWLFCAIIGAFAWAMPMLMLTWGQQYVPSAFAGVAMGAVPLLVFPLVYLFSPDESVGVRRIIGMLIGLVGLVILVAPGAFSGSETDMTLWGRLACVCAAWGYAIGSVLTRRAPKMPPVAMATATLMCSAMIVLPIALLTEPLPQSFSLRPSLALLAAALFPTALGAFIRVRIITTAGSMFMSLTSYMVPVWSVIFGIALMREALPTQLYAALALILIGIFVSQSRTILAALRR